MSSPRSWPREWEGGRSSADPHNLGEARAAWPPPTPWVSSTRALGHLHGHRTQRSASPTFATREQYGDCYDLIHEHPELLTYEAPGTVLVFVSRPARVSRPLLCERLTRAASRTALQSVAAATPDPRWSRRSSRPSGNLTLAAGKPQRHRPAGLETALSSRRVSPDHTPDLETRS